MTEVSVKLEEEEGQLKEEEEEDTKEDATDVFESPESPEVSCSNDEIKNGTAEIESKVKDFEITNESADGKNFDVELDFEGEQASDKEDGEIPGEKPQTEEKGELEEGEDGELTEGDDELEEGELEESGPAAKTPTRQVCRFFNRGKCTFGQVCRFLHLNNNYGRGNYNMFQNNERYPSNSGPWPPGNDPAMGNPRAGGRQDFFVPPFVPPPVTQPSPLESAWERGLLNAKKLVKKAHIRKGSSPDFEEKRLNLSLSQDLPENDKENEKKKGDRQNFYKYEPEPPNWKRHSFDNFEIRYNTNRDFLDVPYREREKGSPPINRRDNYQDRGEKMVKRGGGRQWENDRFGALPRLRAEEWYDPYRRSKSPKGRRSRSRSGSYSTVSSYSYSDRSSVSYSRSSSGSSCDSSRSPSPLTRRKSPSDGITSPKRSDSRLLSRRKPGGRHGRSRSYSRSHSRSRSISRSSSSRSLSMDSISESGNSSPASVGGSKPHVSIMSKKDDDKPEDEIRAKKLFQQLQYLKEKKDTKLGSNRGEDPDDPLNDIMPSQQSSVPAFPSLQHLLPSSDKKDSSKGLQKQQIKLTLLNKSQTNKFSSLQKDMDPAKTKQINDDSKFAGFHSGGGTKRPLSPPSPTPPAKPAPSAAPKKSASSRRDELLKQLKAVEDAIARKRAKFC